MKKSKLSTAVECSQLDIAAIKENMIDSTIELSRMVLSAIENGDEDALTELIDKAGEDAVRAVISELSDVGLLQNKGA